MVRERVGVTGVVRPLDKVEDLKILSIDPEEVGLIKEAPVKRYLAGSEYYDDWSKMGKGEGNRADVFVDPRAQKRSGRRGLRQLMRRFRRSENVSLLDRRQFRFSSHEYRGTNAFLSPSLVVVKQIISRKACEKKPLD